ncbi:MAG TPA: SDR family NAD(P)-dependent oxidoreductase [Mycobacteriales bacterium]|jgi:Dehydrogenases with different specificities (related to short-chain alcohol dehydrogenases)
MGRLNDKVTVITGASTGIGRATMERFAAEGATVVGCARTQSTLDEALSSALAGGGTGMVVAADLSEEDGAQRLIDATIEAYGRIDVLVNNAGVGWAYGEANPGSMAKLHETSTMWWHTVMGINLDSYFYCIRATLPHMIEAGHGSIVNVGSMGGITGLYDGHTYTAAKGAIVNLTRSLAISYVKDGIRTNTVCPGFIDTPMISSVVPAFEDPTVASTLTPIGRPGSPGEIASANLFFASDDSSYCNGATLVVDGGCTARAFPG